MRTPLQVEITLDNLHCYDEADGIGSAEPYLWTIFFKIDGDTVILGDDFFLSGSATVVVTPGSHGNLGDDDVDAGDDVAVPAAIGHFTGNLQPIPVSDAPRALGVQDVGGVVGVIVVLMEEDWVSDSGAEAGHVALNQFIQRALDDIIPTLGVAKQDVSQADIDDLSSRAVDIVSNAVESAQGTWRNVASWLNSDDHIGTKVFTFGHDSLAADAFQPFSQRWHPEVDLPTRFGQVIRVFPVGEWELSGRIQGVQACPMRAAVSLLQSRGLLGEQDAHRAIEGAHAFRQKSFGGRRRLGEWWQLVVRNNAAIAGILNADPALAEEAGVGALLGLTAALGGEAVHDQTLHHVATLLRCFIENGPRRLRIDAKAALAILPDLRGKTIAQCADLLDKQSPQRRFKRVEIEEGAQA